VEEERRRLGDGDRTGEAAAYPGPDGGRWLRREEDERRAKAPERRRGRGVFGNLGLGRSGSGLGMDSVFLFTFLIYDFINHFDFGFSLVTLIKWLPYIVTIINKKIYLKYCPGYISSNHD
jgi:hypothetical protein